VAHAAFGATTTSTALAAALKVLMLPMTAVSRISMLMLQLALLVDSHDAGAAADFCCC
jgi:hypothetical protein